MYVGFLRYLVICHTKEEEVLSKQAKEKKEKKK